MKKNTTEETQVTWQISIEFTDGSRTFEDFSTYEAAKTRRNELLTRGDVWEVTEPEGFMV